MPSTATFALSRAIPEPQYIVCRDFGKIGFESVTSPDATRASIVDDIASGQIDRVAYVIEVFPSEGSSRDITDDIVEAVEARLALAVAAE